MNNTINKPFGFPSATDIVSDTYGNGDKAVYTRATEAGEIFLETNGGPVKVNEYNFNDVTKVECAKDALIDLADKLEESGLLECGTTALFERLAEQFEANGNLDFGRFIRAVAVLGFLKSMM